MSPQYIALSSSPPCEIAWADMSIVYLYKCFVSSLSLLFVGFEPVTIDSLYIGFVERATFCRGRGRLEYSVFMHMLGSI